jgi:hypothetical protein
MLEYGTEKRYHSTRCFVLHRSTISGFLVNFTVYPDSILSFAVFLTKPIIVHFLFWVLVYTHNIMILGSTPIQRNTDKL